MLEIRGDDLYEAGEKISDRFYTSRRAVTSQEHRAHGLAFIAFHHGEEAVNECVSGFDRTGLPEAAWWRKREHAGCEDLPPVELQARHEWALSQLSEEEWRPFNAWERGDLFWYLDTLWMSGQVWMAVQPKSPQIWFRRRKEGEHCA